MSAVRKSEVEKRRDPWALENLDGAVLYDIFYESGTMLSGFLLSVRRVADELGDGELSARCESERLNVRDERAGVEPSDRARQIELKGKWVSRLRQLVDEHPAVFDRSYTTV